jgi:hypothetical protein
MAVDRSQLMARHAEARARRDRSALGSEAFRAAAEEIARIEIEIAALEEPGIDASGQPIVTPPGVGPDRRP